MLKKISNNERLGDPASHLHRLGNALRRQRRDLDREYGDSVPESHLGVSIRFDVWWEDEKVNRTGYPTVRQYAYTDVLKSLWIKPTNRELASAYLVHQVLRFLSANSEEEALKETKLILENCGDKYRLDYQEVENPIDEIVILPGTNILERYINWGQVDEIYNTTGAWIKLHPLTSRIHEYELRLRYPERVISPGFCLYPLIQKSKKLYVPASSEISIWARAAKKDWEIISIEDPDVGGFQPIQDALNILSLRGIAPPIAVGAMWASPTSGIVRFQDPKIMKERFNSYLNCMSWLPHGKETV